MGLPMARRVVAAGFPTAVFNRTAARADPLVEAGAVSVDGARAVAVDRDVIVSVLTDRFAVDAVYGGPDGVLAGLRPGAVVLEMSTIGPAAARALQARVEAAGGTLVEAPVAGGARLAEQGALTALVGGDPADVQRVMPVLRTMTKAQVLLGPVGAGAAMKLALNVYIAAQAQGISELLVIAESGGVAPADAIDALIGSGVASPMAQGKRDAFLDPASAPTSGTLGLIAKDLLLAEAFADQSGLRIPAARAASRLMSETVRAVGAESDMARVLESLRQPEPIADHPRTNG